MVIFLKNLGPSESEARPDEYVICVLGLLNIIEPQILLLGMVCFTGRLMLG